MNVYLPEYQVNCFISDDNLHIQDSFAIRDDKDKEAILNKLLKMVPNYPRRNMKSLIREWKAHNILYRWGWFKQHTVDVDLNVDESKFKLFCYFIISTLFRE